MRTSGLRVEAREGFDEVVPVRALHLHELQVEDSLFDLMLLSERTYDTDWIATLAARHLTADGAIVVCQNGIKDARAAALVGAERTVGCVVTFAGSLLEPGHVIRADAYPVALRVGALPDVGGPRVEDVAYVLNHVVITDITPT